MSPAPPVEIPAAALWLGASGAVPFVALGVAALVLDGTLHQQALAALTAYGAVILSFMGAVHWGLAIASHASAAERTPEPYRLAASVVPALVGWAAMLVSGVAGLLVMAAAFAGVLMFDLREIRLRHAPSWYPKLRRPLSAVVIAALLTAAAA